MKGDFLDKTEMDEIEKEIYRHALNRATELVSKLNKDRDTGATKIKQLIFPFWVDAIHEMCIKVGCSCQKGKQIKGKCFLKYKPDIQIKNFSDTYLCFDAFLLKVLNIGDSPFISVAPFILDIIDKSPTRIRKNTKSDD